MLKLTLVLCEVSGKQYLVNKARTVLHSTRVEADPTGKYVFGKVAHVLGITVKHFAAWNENRQEWRATETLVKDAIMRYVYSDPLAHMNAQRLTETICNEL